MTKPLAAPDASQKFPLAGYERLAFLNQLIQHPQVEIGDYSYYDDFDTVDNFIDQIRYLFSFTGDRLRIGKFCMIASGAEFIMNGGNHLSEAVSAYPFSIFGQGWAHAMEGKTFPSKGDTVVGHDVWIGYKATILPGVTIGHGAIVGAHSVVTKDVTPYTIVAGNPAKPIKLRFTQDIVDQLLSIEWWNWPLEKITQHVHLLTSEPAAFLAIAQHK